ncbi:MAG TPA: hypothetical protein VL651_06000 [Bacteroidia bacterium]|jgi:hypothetical protein|nr:hypothetical protein [Bacteroidia bacterium]
MEGEKILFEERQYHGLNRHSIVRRLLFAVFCFVAYYWSENPKPVNLELFRIGSYPGRDHSGQLFFVLGISILALSGILLFITHMKTTVTEKAVLLDGTWKTKRVRIDLNGIVSARIVRIRPSIFNRPVFNLHSKGRIRFYTYGSELVELTTRDGLLYRIGTQRSGELIKALNKPDSRA